jgi:membrane protein YqaA with SNARE-associated domain
MKKLYQWVLNWANSPYSGIVLFFLAFTESVFFPVPSDVLFIALALGAASKSYRYALICTIGSISGALVGYALGSYLWLNADGGFTVFAQFFYDNIPGFSVEIFDQIKLLFNHYDFWVIFVAGFIPVPYKVFTISSGVFDINLVLFAIASLISRGARFFILAWLIKCFGLNVKLFIDKYFNLLALGLSASLLEIFFVIKYLT